MIGSVIKEKEVSMKFQYEFVPFFKICNIFKSMFSFSWLLCLENFEKEYILNLHL